MLEDAGYTDADGDGVREDKQGKPIELRLWTRTESPPQQRAGKLIAGWFDEIGLKIKLSVMTDGGIYDGLYNYTNDGKTYAPDFDMYIWGWPGGIDPDGILSCFTTSAIEWWNDCSWSNAEYDELEKQQITEMDWPTREKMVQRMQQIFYEEAPDVVLYYPDSLMAYNSDKWEGWVPYPTEDGMVVNTHTIDTYIAAASQGDGDHEHRVVEHGAHRRRGDRGARRDRHHRAARAPQPRSRHRGVELTHGSGEGQATDGPALPRPMGRAGARTLTREESRRVYWGRYGSAQVRDRSHLADASDRPGRGGGPRRHERVAVARRREARVPRRADAGGRQPQPVHRPVTYHH